MSCDTEYLKKQLLIFPETWSPSFCIVCNCFDDFRTSLPKNIGRFHRKQNTKFPKRRRVRSKNVSLSAALLFSLIVKKWFWELPQISLIGTLRVFCSNAKSRFGCASFRRLRLVLSLFTSCVWDVLRYRILKKTAFDFFWETWSPSFCIVCNCFDDIRTNLPKILGVFTGRRTQIFQNDVEYVPKLSFWALLCLFLAVTTKIFFENFLRSHYLGTIRVFHSNAESRFGCASFRRLSLVLWLLTSCVRDVLGYRILIKTAFVYWAKQKLSKTTLSTFQKCLFELCWACFFGGN